jgi:glycosyltransferase involved in cell wall biosynthesis
VTLAFIGHYAPLSRALMAASAPSGNQVQREILAELQAQSSGEPAFGVSMTPAPAWPRGPVAVPGIVECDVRFPALVNLPLLKHLVFAVRVLLELVRRRPRLCVQYNAYVFENLALLAYRTFAPRSRIALVVQDVYVRTGAPRLSRAGLRAATERLALRLARRFDLVVPVSADIVRDFRLAPERCLLFPGGVTRFARELARVSEDAPLDDIAVIAGALEPHNGADVLVRRWVEAGVRSVLHVFGRGPLAGVVADAAARSDRVVFHGLQPEAVVVEWQRRARWNFCLRYGIGLHEGYFFPSKLFHVLCAPGVPIANDFRGLPDALRPHLCLVGDDLADLAARLEASSAARTPEGVRQRRAMVMTEYSWTACIREVVERLAPSAHA